MDLSRYFVGRFTGEQISTVIDLNLNQAIFAGQDINFLVKSLNNLNYLLIRISTALQAVRTKNVFSA